MPNINQTPRDKNGQPHGEWLIYYDKGKLDYRWNYVHGIKHGLEESYYSDGELMYTGYYNMNRKVGYWYYRNKKKYHLCLI